MFVACENKVSLKKSTFIGKTADFHLCTRGCFSKKFVWFKKQKKYPNTYRTITLKISDFGEERYLNLEM